MIPDSRHWDGKSVFRSQSPQVTNVKRLGAYKINHSSFSWKLIQVHKWQSILLCLFLQPRRKFHHNMRKILSFWNHILGYSSQFNTKLGQNWMVHWPHVAMKSWLNWKIHRVYLQTRKLYDFLKEDFNNETLDICSGDTY